jgi:hypothetical protein
LLQEADAVKAGDRYIEEQQEFARSGWEQVTTGPPYAWLPNREADKGKYDESGDQQQRHQQASCIVDQGRPAPRQSRPPICAAIA